MEKSTHGWLIVCAMLLLVVAGLLASDMYFRMDEQQRRQKVSDEVMKTVLEVETQRLEVFSDYSKALDSYETKSVYHQIYHANNAQLKMMALMVQENQLLAMLIAGKK
jgi:hypothetical protein